MPLGGFSKDKLVFDPSAPTEGDNAGSYTLDGYGNQITSNAFGYGFAYYSGTPAGATNPVTITAVNGGTGGAVSIPVTGSQTINQAITAWNIANPTNKVSLTQGDGSQTPTVGTIPLTGGGPQQALNVNLVGSQLDLTVDINGIYSSPNNIVPANVGIIGSTRNAPGLANQTLQFTGGAPSSDALSPTNIVAQDVNGFNMVWNGTGWDRLSGSAAGGANVNITGSTNPIQVTQSTSPWIVAGGVADDAVDSQNPVKVGSRSHWGLLPAISTSDDRADLLSDKYRRVYVNNGANVGMAHNNLVASNGGQVALQSGGSALDGRRLIMVQNNSNKAVYIGKTGLTSANSLVLAAGAAIELDAGQDLALFVLGSAASQDVRVFEMA
jgi:hypothetical protein